MAGIIRQSVILYVSPVLFGLKKDGKLRLCIDYLRLKLDLQSGFHHLQICKGNQYKTAFTTPGAAGA